MFLFVRVDNTKLVRLCQWSVYIWCEKPSVSRAHNDKINERYGLGCVRVCVCIWSKIECQEYINSICRFFLSSSLLSRHLNGLCLYIGIPFCLIQRVKPNATQKKKQQPQVIVHLIKSVTNRWKKNLCKSTITHIRLDWIGCHNHFASFHSDHPSQS